MDFEAPPIPRRQRPQRPSYAPVTRELLLDGGFKDRPGLPIAEANPGEIVRSPSDAIMPQPPGAIVHQPRGLAVHQHYPVYATPGFISSEPETKTQPASKARFRLRKLPKLKLPKLKLPKLPKLQLPNWKRPTPATTTTTNQSQPKSQSGKPSKQLAGLKLPKPALSGVGFGSIGLSGKSGKSGGKGGADNFEDDPIAQLLVKVFLVLLILIPLIL